MSYNFAIIDLGSNSVRMNINSIEKDGAWSTLQKLRATVRLSEGMSSDNFLKENAMNRVIDALSHFCDKAKEYMRSNPDFTDMIYKAVMDKINAEAEEKERQRLERAEALKAKKD